jgi:alpha-tubulin suppressor-like RCC1 family protein
MGQLCQAGACVTVTVIGCGAPLVSCGGVCKDTKNDAANCGGCGVVCGTGQYCVGGTCQLACGGDWLACGSTCVNPAVDPNNCGTCGNVCAIKCVTGTCLKVTKAFSGVYSYSSFALMNDGTFRAWGYNTSGQLGDGTTTTPRTSPVIDALGANVVDASSGGSYHTCVVLADGTAKCIGANTYGQLGNNSTTASSTAWVVVGGPTPLTGITQITAGLDFSCARMSDATVKCWGSNALGQLGDGLGASGVKGLVPQAVPGLTNVAEVRAGAQFACARKTDKTVVCWGVNTAGQVGDGTTANKLSPVAVTGLTNAVQLTTTANGACAILDDKTVKCWGDGSQLALGNGGTATTNATTPTTVVGVGGVGTTLNNVIAISGGYQHYCALLADTSIACWGYDSYGQLGDGLSASSSTPKAVASLTGVAQIIAGRLQTCALLGSGALKCWGYNAYGQLGDGTTTNRVTPTDVKF